MSDGAPPPWPPQGQGQPAPGAAPGPSGTPPPGYGPPGHPPSGGQTPPAGGGGRGSAASAVSAAIAVGVGVVVVLAAAVGFLLLRSDDEGPSPSAEVEETANPEVDHASAVPHWDSLDDPATGLLGETVTLVDGLEITVDEIEPYELSGESDAELDAGEQAVAVHITAVNESPHVVTIDNLVDVQPPAEDEYDVGQSSFRQILDSPGGLRTFGPDLEPGTTEEVTYGFAVPPDAAAETSVSLTVTTPLEEAWATFYGLLPDT